MNSLTRYSLYFLLLTLQVAASSIAIQTMGVNKFLLENGVVEICQVICLALTAFVLYCAGKHSEHFGSFYKVLSLFPVVAFIRENDYVLDTYVFDGVWQLLVGVTFVYLVYKIIKKSGVIGREFSLFTRTQPFICFILGFFFVFAWARIIGQQNLWQAMLQEMHHRNVGRFIEEVLEFLGYTIMLIGAVECLYLARKKQENVAAISG